MTATLTVASAIDTAMIDTAMIEIALPQHDIGVREVAVFSARASYVLMCFTLCWGIFTATGWIRRLTGHQAIRSSHMVLATMTVATGVTHAMVFLLLREQGLSIAGVVVPFSGRFRHAFGILGLELMIAITLATSLKNYVNYRRWLRFHQLAYPAVALVVVHSWFGAIANGHLGVTWLAGVTVLTPAITLTALRLTPPNLLIRAGLLSPAPKAVPPQVIETRTNGAVNGYARNGTKIAVSVDNQRCRRYGICQAESPDLFQLLADGRLRYVRDPENGKRAGAQAAARACPMQAIQLQEVRNR